MSPMKKKATINLSQEDLEDILSDHWEHDINLFSCKMWPLTNRGDNYNSTMAAVDVKFNHNFDVPQKLSLVAKLLPPSAFLREVINIDITFRKEVNAYMLVFPEFENLQLESGIPQNEICNIFPKFYGARLNSNGDMNEKADDKAVLLLENLKVSGYSTGDRSNGLDFKHMKLAVSQLAQFHAFSVALKILKPQVFKETVLKACEGYKIASKTDESGLPKWIASTMNYVRKIPECENYLNRVENALIQFVKNPLPPQEPFAALIHNDFWVNNMMFRYHQGKSDIPIGIKLVDFQLTQFSSPAKDLVFFIYSSAALDVIDNHYEDLVHIYHHQFNNCLLKFGCNTKSFSFQNLQDEINTYGSSEFAHILMMLKFICADEDKLPDLSDSNIEELLEINTGGDIYANRVIHLIEDFIQKGWL